MGKSTNLTLQELVKTFRKVSDQGTQRFANRAVGYMDIGLNLDEYYSREFLMLVGINPQDQFRAKVELSYVHCNPNDAYEAFFQRVMKDQATCRWLPDSNLLVMS